MATARHYLLRIKNKRIREVALNYSYTRRFSDTKVSSFGEAIFVSVVFSCSMERIFFDERFWQSAGKNSKPKSTRQVLTRLRSFGENYPLIERLDSSINLYCEGEKNRRNAY